MTMGKYMNITKRPAITSLDTIHQRLATGRCVRCGDKAQPRKSFCGPCWSTGDCDSEPVMVEETEE